MARVRPASARSANHQQKFIHHWTLSKNRFGEVEKASFQKELPTVLGTEGMSMCCYLERDSFWKVSI